MGFLSIGSGERHADIAFIENNYLPTFDIPEALYVIYEAKRRAEKAPGVGKETDIAIILSEKIIYINEDEDKQIMEELERIFQQRIDMYEKGRGKTKNMIKDLGTMLEERK